MSLVTKKGLWCATNTASIKVMGVSRARYPDGIYCSSNEHATLFEMKKKQQIGYITTCVCFFNNDEITDIFFLSS